ncbi:MULTISPECIES: alpha/beta fold hydrolase [Shewanella]|uniref:alpha/beta fold hydrolase n=1 Tax=Shewanella TaxID=22 RepID=UPI001BC450B3|nr:MULTISPECIES: alpha/beta hydrolase [Shewanella]GIU54243.1 2-succinyl-6-hydroxy-2,4-cyclohexadiene-1-carboxy late synthase [Shewanella sp. KT0246]
MTQSVPLSVNIDSHQLHYTDEGQGPVLFFIHGFLSDNTMWRPQIEQLSQNYRCIAVDLWAHGQSEAMPSGTTSLITIAEHCLALLTSLEIENCTVLGNGTGGAIAAEMVLSKPTKISKLVLSNAFIGFEPQVNCAKYQGWIDQANEQKECSASLAEIVANKFFIASQESEAKNALVHKLTNLSALQIEQLALFSPLALYKRDTLELVEQFALPCLIMIGEQNQLRTMLEAYLMQDCISGSQLVQIANGGHFSNIEQAEKVNQTLETFLS